MTDPKRDMLYACFAAKWLPPLKAFQDFNHESGSFLHKGCITIEPCGAGGVLIVAAAGNAAAVIHDAGGYASRPMHIMVPAAAFAAAKAPEPVRMTFEGWDYECELPEWAQPDDVHVHNSGISITTKMRHPQWAEEDKHFHPALFSRTVDDGPHIRPGQDFRISEGRAVEWQPLLLTARKDKQVQSADWSFAPWVVNLFDPLLKVLAAGEERAISHRTVLDAKGNRMAIATVTDRPEFVGLWMHNWTRPRQDIAEPFFATASAVPETAQ